MEHLKYPIGRFEHGKDYTASEDHQHIAEIEQYPSRLKALVSTLTPEQLGKSYRPEGWTGRQIIHHIADSHINAYIRTKLALTETSPTIKPYGQEAWAELPDGKQEDIETSMLLIDALHKRWSYLLRSLSSEELQKKYIHPEYNRELKLSELVALYAWHGKQHYEHLRIIKEQSHS